MIAPGTGETKSLPLVATSVAGGGGTSVSSWSISSRVPFRLGTGCGTSVAKRCCWVTVGLATATGSVRGTATVADERVSAGASSTAMAMATAFSR